MNRSPLPLAAFLALAATFAAQASTLLPAPVRPTKFPLQRPNQEGTLFAWGSSHTSMEPPFGLHRVVQIASGYNHSMALLADGSVRRWGYQNMQPAALSAEATRVVQIASGQDFGMALRQDGRVFAGGVMRFGSDRLPAFVPQNLPKVVQIAAGRNHALGLTPDGRVLAWGNNAEGQCRDMGLKDIVQVAAGDQYSMALRADGTVVAWGDELNRAFDSPVNVPLGLGSVAKIAAGEEHAVALLRNGRVVAWGSNKHGQAPSNFGVNTAVDIAAGTEFTAVVLRSGRARVWSNVLNTEFSRWPDASPVLQVAGRRIGLALTRSRLVTWGRFADRSILSVAPDTTRAADVAAGSNHALVRMSDGKVAAWSAWGNLAGEKMPRNLPPVRKIAAGENHSAVVTMDGRVFAWAHRNEDSESLVPEGVRGIKDIAAGSDYLLALRNDGTVLTWTLDGNLLPSPRFRVKIKQIGVASGEFNYGLAENGDLYRWSLFLNRPGANVRVIRTNVASFASSFTVQHILALNKKGVVAAFDISGVENTKLETSVPFGLKRAIKAAVGPSYCIVLQADGTLRSWGQSSGSQGGIGSPPDGLRNVSAVAVGQNFVLALRHPASKP